MIEYEVGDTITYETFGGTPRTVVVRARYDDVKNGLPGFTGDNSEGSFWGYDDQIVRVEVTEWPVAPVP